ncbi:MAG TPA: DUF4430 domain-containing protein [Bacilli bacterium]|jgi:hypothetical protein|nr:DUF4430 domain-containing protein [Bacilli bacterium]HPL54976.1 DUF4430 domain-containing protein [Bacilli bacterium]
MKRKFTILTLVIVLVFGLFVVSGCKKKAEGEGNVTVQIVDFDGKELFNDEIKFDADDTLVDLLKNHKKIKMTGETSEYGFYVVSLCGVSASNEDHTYWSIEVNGEYSLVGVSDIVLVDGIEIAFLLIGW